MTLKEFLDKETPKDGGCMLCLAKYKQKGHDHETEKYIFEPTIEEYMLVERRTISNGDMFLINGRFYYDFDFAWDGETPWEILYKRKV